MRVLDRPGSAYGDCRVNPVSAKSGRVPKFHRPDTRPLGQHETTGNIFRCAPDV